MPRLRKQKEDLSASVDEPTTRIRRKAAQGSLDKIKLMTKDTIFFSSPESLAPSANNVNKKNKTVVNVDDDEFFDEEKKKRGRNRGKGKKEKDEEEDEVVVVVGEVEKENESGEKKDDEKVLDDDANDDQVKSDDEEEKSDDDAVDNRHPTQIRKKKEELSSLSISELKNLCKNNDLTVGGSKGELIDRVADAMVNGPPSRCPTCFGGRIYYNSKKKVYYCKGFYDEDHMHRCSYESETCQREKWKDV